MLTNDRSYIEACFKLNALAEFRRKVETLQEEIHGLVIAGHLDESDGSIATGSLTDWLTDRESDWNVEELRDEVMEYATNVEAA